MLDRRLHRFYLSYRSNTKLETIWIDGINLRHAKEKLQMMVPDASDVMDWTYEKPEDLEKYLNKFKALQEKKLKDLGVTKGLF